MAGGDILFMLKQYLRWLPAQIGLFNRGAYYLQIDKIVKDDIFIVSYPKSGNTWVRFLLSNIKCSGEKINFDNIDSYIPDVYTSKALINKQKSNRIIKTHHCFFEYYPKSIYIYRDYRDVLVSYYFYEKALGNFSGTISEFLTSDNLKKPFGLWKNHVSKAIQFKKNNPERIFMLSYESLYQNSMEQVKLLADFCNLTPQLSFEEILNRCQFSTLKENEKIHESEFKKRTTKHFFREGKKDNWNVYLNNSDLEFLQKDKELVLLMKELKYSF